MSQLCINPCLKIRGFKNSKNCLGLKNCGTISKERFGRAKYAIGNLLILSSYSHSKSENEMV